MKQGRINSVCGGILAVVIVFLSPLVAQEESLPPGGQDDRGSVAYLSKVKSYAETLLEHGRDTYGTVHSPLIATTLDRRTLKMFPPEDVERLWKIRLDDWENWKIRNTDRAVECANPMHDEDLYQILYALSEITGEDRYAREADRTLGWFFKNCQSPATSLLPWGEHMGWNLSGEGIFQSGAIKAKTEQDRRTHAYEIHEFGRPWVLWARSFKIAPVACLRFARGLWEHQIADHETGNFSRHANYSRHRPFKNSEYPRHGGFFIACWAEAYARTGDAVFLKAIDTLVSGFDRRRSPISGAVPAESNQRSGGKMLWAFSNLSLAIDVWTAAGKVPEDLGKKLRDFSRKSDAVFLKLKHKVGSEGGGFFLNGHLDTLEPYGGGGWSGYSGFWDEAGIANVCYLRYRQEENPGYRELILKAAEGRLAKELTREEVIHPPDVGAQICLMLDAHELTGDRRFLDRADTFGRKGVALFLDDVAPLPKATVKYDHYEAVTGGDTLMMSLLKLWLRKNHPERQVRLVWSIR